MNARLSLAILLPFLALAVQWVLWPWIAPFVWFLFFPTVFFSARLGGLWGGLTSTALSTGLVWFFFIPPQLDWKLNGSPNLYSVGLFLFMGYLFSDAQERLRRTRQKTEAALAASEAAERKVTGLYRETLELDELKSQFFANISHELRTPLTLILAPLECCLRRPSGTIERQDIELMLRNARLLYRHVTDLLDVAKLDAGRMGLAWSRIDLAHLLRVTASHFEVLAAERHIDYTISVPCSLPAEADSEKLQRVLLNLLSNAFKYTPEGGAIGLRLAQQEDTALIEVQDNGPGVPAHLRKAVFERFRQVEGNIRRRHGGTGLGLSIVKDLIEMHGGNVRLDQAPGGGTLVSVRLPLAAPVGTIFGNPMPLDEVIDRQAIEELEVRKPTPPDAQAVRHGTPLVLVVEDNIDMNQFITALLQPLYRVAWAFDGRDGVDRALALRPDLILCDVMMPVMSGEEMVEALRRQPTTCEIPIVVLTAKSDEDLRLRLLQKGVEYFLNKPFSTEELLAQVGRRISDRLRAREKLSQSDARFEATFEQAAVGIALVAPDGRWLRANQKLCEIVGYSHDELLATTFQDISFPDDLETDLTQMRQMLAGEIAHYAMEKRYIRKDGSLVWVGLTVALARQADGNPDYFISVVEDIQRRKQAEQDVQQGKITLEAALASMTDAVFISDAEGRFVEFNDAFATFHKFNDKSECATTLAEYPQFLDVFTANGKLAPLEQWAVPRALRGETATGAEYTLHRKDTGETWVGSYSFAPIRNQEGVIVGSVVTGRDITAQKQAAEEILRLNAELEQRVESRTAELTAANRELDAFAYAVSHDLRAPLRAMSGFSQALTEDYGSLLQGEARVFLDQISLASLKMSELIDGILALSRCTRGELRNDAVDISAVAHRQLAELAQSEPARQVAVQVEAGLEARGDARMIEAVLRNLLENAWKYSAHATAPSIRVYAEERGGVRYFCVADNGAGFDMAHAGKLFQPFRRLHRQEEFPGIGIGLATVQRIVHRHGGDIEAQGEPGKGAVFCFSLAQQPVRREKSPYIGKEIERYACQHCTAGGRQPPR